MMPLPVLRSALATARLLVGPERSDAADRALATVLTAVAGAANAGGFFALGHYTSHMTGYLSQMADGLAVLNLRLALLSALALAAFVTGAACSTALIHWARARTQGNQFSLPIAVQGGLLFCFSFGGIFTQEAGRLFALACLCFIMGMQNATITKISEARIRTTHATGMLTDIGIELGRWLVSRVRRGGPQADRAKLRLLSSLVLAFVLGGLTGAIGYDQIGYFFSMPLALILLSLGLAGLRRDALGKGPQS